MPLGWAIISTGQHPDLKIAPAIAAAEDQQLAAVYSRDRERAEAFAEKHGAAAAYDSLDALLQDSRVDAVFIASPNFLHCQHALQAARAGKHVLAEKPMTTTLEDAIAMVRGCRENGVKLGTGYHLRTHPGHILARRVIADGTLGPVTLAQAQWGRGVRGHTSAAPRTGLRSWWGDPQAIGGAASMMGTGVHALDLLRFLLGQEVTLVAAITDGQTLQQPLENTVALSLRFDGGAIATMCSGRLLPDTQNDFAVYGSEGRVTGKATLWEARQGRVDVVSETVNTTTVCNDEYLGNFIAELKDFYQAIVEDRDPVASGLDGLRVVQVTLGVIESAREGRTVKIEPVEV